MKYGTNTLICCWGAIASGNAWLASGNATGFIFLAIGVLCLFLSMGSDK